MEEFTIKKGGNKNGFSPTLLSDDNRSPKRVIPYGGPNFIGYSFSRTEQLLLWKELIFMKMIYVVQGTSTGCNGNIIHWADSAYTDEQEAIKRCDRMNRSMKNDQNFFAYVTGPIPYEQKG